MDDRLAFGVIQALGKALASRADALDALRAAKDADALAAIVRAAPTPLAAERVAEFIAAHATASAWDKTRAKLILAVQLARGSIARKPGHEEKGGVRGKGH